MCCTAASAVPGNALRIAVELSEAPTGSVIWADRFDGEIAELFDLQDRIALRVATAIAPQLARARTRVARCASIPTA